MSVILYHNIVAPYRHALFTELAARLDLEVWFSAERTRDRQWSTRVPPTYVHRVLSHRIRYGFGRPLIYCPTLIRDLDARPPVAVIAVLTRSNAADVIRLCRWGRARGRPVVLWIGATELDPRLERGLPWPVEALFEWYHRFAIRRAAGFVYYSALSRQWAERRGARGPFAVGTQVLDEAPLAPRLTAPPPDAPIRVLFVGKLERRKGVDLLVSALARLDADLKARVTVRLAGDGPLAELARQLPARGVTAIMLGHVDRAALWAEYQAADLLVVPSRHDPWANVVNEAMAMGTPVLASAQAGSAELAVRAGWVVDLADADALVRNLALAIRECREPGRRAAAVEAERAYRPGPSAERVAALIRALVGADQARGLPSTTEPTARRAP